nr:chromosome partitioning protein ParB [Escherichia coli]
WSLEMFRDELIGDLLKALPHPVLDYDRWLLELDPRERNRRHHFGEPEPVLIPADSDAMPEPATDGVSAVTAEKNSGREQSVISAPADHDTVMNTEQSPAGKAESSVIEQREERRRKEVQPDMYGGEETYSGDYEEDGDTRDA